MLVFHPSDPWNTFNQMTLAIIKPYAKGCVYECHLQNYFQAPLSQFNLTGYIFYSLPIHCRIIFSDLNYIHVASVEIPYMPLQWRHNVMGSQITGVSIVYSTVFFRRRSKKTLKLRVTGLCAGNSPVTGEFPAQRASNTENVSIWLRHHVSPNLAGLTNFVIYVSFLLTFSQ